MKYIKVIFLSILGAAALSSCQKDEGPIDPGTAVVNFGQTSVTVSENSGLFTVPLELTGEPGGYPVTVNITATGVDDIDQVLLITSTTIKITENNDSFVQMIPVWQPTINDDFTVTLTIESANGANIGSSNTCNVTIENVMAVQYGQYTFKTSNGSPSEWTLILRKGANGTYIMENMFDVSDSPKLIGEFDAENMQMTFDGRVNGFGDANYNGKIGWGQRGSDYLAFQCSSPMVFTVNENMELEGTNAQFFFLLLIMDETGSAITKQETLASFAAVSARLKAKYQAIRNGLSKVFLNKKKNRLKISAGFSFPHAPTDIRPAFPSSQADSHTDRSFGRFPGRIRFRQ